MDSGSVSLRMQEMHGVHFACPLSSPLFLLSHSHSEWVRLCIPPLLYSVRRLIKGYTLQVCGEPPPYSGILCTTT